MIGYRSFPGEHSAQVAKWYVRPGINLNPVLSLSGLILHMTLLQDAHTILDVSLSSLCPSLQFLHTSLYVLNTPVCNSSRLAVCTLLPQTHVSRASVIIGCFSGGGNEAKTFTISCIFSPVMESNTDIVMNVIGNSLEGKPVFCHQDILHNFLLHQSLATPLIVFHRQQQDLRLWAHE